jgi:hypothetical protein
VRGKVGRDARRQIEREKERQREEFGRTYDKMKTVVFLSGDELNRDKFVVFPKDLLDYGLSLAALAVYPVLCSRADFKEDKPFQLSQDNIAFLAGVSVKVVRKALDRLEEAELLTREKVTEGTRHFYMYKVFFIRKPMLGEKEHKGNKVYFHTCIIDSGVWARLRPSAKALYLVMRTKAVQDLDLYSSIESDVGGNTYESMEYDEYIRQRKWDVCPLSLAELCRLLYINPTAIQPALAELEHHRLRLIERVGEWIKVYLKPRV